MSLFAAGEKRLYRAGNFGSFATRVINSPIVREVAGTFGTRLVLIVAGLGASVLTARLLGPEGRGIFAVGAASAALCIQFGNLGLHASNTYTVARNARALPALIANSLLVSLMVGAIVFVLAEVTTMLAPTALPLPSAIRTIAVATVPFGLAYLLLQNLLIGTGRIRQYNVLEVALKVFGVSALLLLAVMRWVTPETVFTVTLATSILGCMAALWILPKLSSVHLKLHRDVMASTLRYGLKAYAAGLFAYVTLRFDLLMVQHYRGAIDSGYYSIAAGYGDLVYLLPTVVGTILFPRLSALPTDAERWALTRRAFGGLGTLMVGGVALAAVVAPYVIRLLYGAEFVPAIPAIMWLMPGLAFLSLNTVFMNYFASMGMPLVAVISPAIAAAVNVGLNIVMIPKSGIVGASIASSISYGLMLACSIIYIANQRRSV